MLALGDNTKREWIGGRLRADFLEREESKVETKPREGKLVNK
jgi:hypothetical protein